MSFGSLSSAVLLINFPESPKYLLTKGDTKQALVILKYVFSKNTGKTMEEFPVRNILFYLESNLVLLGPICAISRGVGTRSLPTNQCI